MGIKQGQPGILMGVGECMVELSETGTGHLSRAFAGDVFNTLWYFQDRAQGDWASSFFSAVGDDPLSDEMARFIGSGGIGTTHLQRMPGKRPGLYMIHLDGVERSFSYWRDSSAARSMLRDPALLETALRDSSVVYLSGITLGILAAGDIEALFDALDRSTATVVFDPNIRPALWSDEGFMKSTLTRAGELAHIVFPSFDDEARVFGDSSPDDTISRYGMENRLVVVKDGPAPVHVGLDGHIQRFETPKVTDAIDTTGAGDSFNGAFLAEYLETEDIVQSVAQAQACSAAVIRHKGALVPRSQ